MEKKMQKYFSNIFVSSLYIYIFGSRNKDN